MKKLIRPSLHGFLQCLVIISALTFSMQLRGQTLVDFNASLLTGSATQLPVASVVANLSSTPITRNNVNATNSNGTFSSDNWPQNPTTAPSGSKYLTFTLTPSAGYALNLNSATISFDLRRSGSGPNAAYIYTSVAGFASSANSLVTITPIVSSGATAVNYTFPSSGYNSLLSAEIRIYADQATGTGGVLRLMNPGTGGNIRITGGSVTSCVPVISSVSSNSPVCSGSTLNLSSAATSGVLPISYSWTGPNSFSSSSQNPSIPSVTTLAAGTYTVNASNLCGSSSSTTSVSVNPPITVSMSGVNASCDNNDGTASVAAGGGSGSFTYLWSPSGQTTATATSLSSGTYTCIVTDLLGCSNSGTVTITAASCGPTQLSSGSCGVTLSALNQNIYCQAVTGATNYQYKFKQGATTIVIYTRGNYLTNCNLSTIPVLRYAQTYQVAVSSYVGSSWSSFGPSCNVTTPAFPAGQVSSYQCGTTLPSLTTQLYCNTIIGATNYEWKFMQGTAVIATYQRGNWINNCLLTNIPAIQYGQTYDVYVRGYEGGEWGPYGSACSISTPAFPTTQVSSAWCNGSVTNLSSGITCNAVPGATNYQWQVQAGAYISTMNRGNNQTNWRLSWNAGTTVSTLYTVSVRAYVAGVWGPFGTPCTIYVGPNLFPQYNRDEAVPPEVRLANPGAIFPSDELFMEVYPNPFAENITVTTNSEIGKLIIYNAVGESVKTILLEDGVAEINLSEFPSGIYMIQVQTSSGTITKKVIKQ